MPCSYWVGLSKAFNESQPACRICKIGYVTKQLQKTKLRIGFNMKVDTPYISEYYSSILWQRKSETRIYLITLFCTPWQFTRAWKNFLFFVKQTRTSVNRSFDSPVKNNGGFITLFFLWIRAISPMNIRRLKSKFATDVNSLSCALAN